MLYSYTVVGLRKLWTRSRRSAKALTVHAVGAVLFDWRITMKLNERYNTMDVCKALDKASKSYREIFDEMKADGVRKKFFDTMVFDGLICEDPKATVVFTRALDGKRFEGEVKLSSSCGGKVSPCWVEQVTYTAYADSGFSRFSVCDQNGKRIFTIKHEKSA